MLIERETEEDSIGSGSHFIDHQRSSGSFSSTGELPIDDGTGVARESVEVDGEIITGAEGNPRRRRREEREERMEVGWEHNRG